MTAQTAESTQLASARRSLAERIRAELGPPPALSYTPMVSAVVLNRDGRSHLEQLLEGLTRTTDYPAIELVVVDNGSDDDSVEFLRGADPPFPVKVAENEGNASFSEGCNQGAELGSGDLLLFLNNDIELFEPGWLRELVGCLERSSAHAVGATLLHGETSAARIGAGSSWVLQHRGVNFGRQLGYVVPLNVADGDPLWPSVGSDRPSLGATAACLLVDRSAFDSVAGFTVGFQYGWEDVDLGLKLISSGRSVVCSGRSFAFHDEGATRRARERGFRRHNRAVNQRLFMRRWGPAVYRSYLLDRLTGGTLWSHDDKAHLGVVGDPADLDRLPVGGLATGLRDHGWRVTAVPAGEDEPPDDLDCALVVSAECAPPAESVVSVAWVGWPPAAWIDQGRLPSFELVLAESPDIAQELEKRTGREVIVLPPTAADPAAELGELIRTRIEARRFFVRCAPADAQLATAVQRALEARGHLCPADLEREESDLVSLTADVAIHMTGGLSPAPAQFNVLAWPRTDDRAVEAELDWYDLIVVPTEADAEQLRRSTGTDLDVLPAAGGEADRFAERVLQQAQAANLPLRLTREGFR